MKSVLVTGGAGYIGSHACKALAAAGYEPVVYDDLSRGHAWAVKWGPLEQGSLSDRAKLQEVFSRHRPVAVMHFAALAYVGESVTDPARYYQNNITGTWQLLEAMREAGVRHIVLSGSCSVYGDGHDRPIPETAPMKPMSPYGLSKFVSERMLEDYGRAYGLQWLTLRYFNAAGADPDGEIGEDHEPETHLIPLVLAAAAGTNPNLKVFGNDYPTPDGTCVRDYIHVTDLAAAHAHALGRMLRDGMTGAFNLGTGTGHSVKQVLDTARRITGREIPHQLAPRRPGDPAFAVADNSRLREVLRWQPAHSDLDTIVRTAWEWACREETGRYNRPPSPGARAS